MKSSNAGIHLTHIIDSESCYLWLGLEEIPAVVVVYARCKAKIEKCEKCRPMFRSVSLALRLIQ